MADDGFSLPVIDALTAQLGLRALRHRAIASNLANVDTPGYARIDVGFRRELLAALGGGEPPLARTHPGHLAAEPAGPEAFFYAEPAVMRADGNGVDIDREMAELVRNALEYATVSRLIGDALARLRVAIEGR